MLYINITKLHQSLSVLHSIPRKEISHQNSKS